MRFPIVSLVVVAATASNLNFVQGLTENPQGCVDSYDATVDYFPVKVEPTQSEFWSIEYSNSYKVLTNLANNATFLLYQCGTPIPSDGITYNATVSVPIQKVSFSQVNTIPYLEQLNRIESVKAYTSDVSFINSPCLLESIMNGLVWVAPNRTTIDEYVSTDFSASINLDVDDVVAFHGAYDTDLPFEPDRTIITNTELEKTNGALFEWVKFFGAFYNDEAVANTVFDATESRVECIQKGAALSSSDAEQEKKPIVFWAYYSEYCLGWSVAKCPNYYCEFAKTCSVDIISVNETAGSIEACGTNFFSLEEMVEIGKDADYWIYAGFDWDVTYSKYKTELDTFTSVQNGNVYDIAGSGMNAWFEQRYAEYYDVIQDFCAAVGTSTNLLNKPGWFRNAMQNETARGMNVQCADVNATPILTQYKVDECEFLPSSTPDTTNVATTTGSPSGAAATGSSSGAATTGLTSVGLLHVVSSLLLLVSTWYVM